MPRPFETNSGRVAEAMGQMLSVRPAFFLWVDKYGAVVVAQVARWLRQAGVVLAVVQ